MRSFRRVLVMATCLAAVLVLGAGLAVAGGKPGPESCDGVGMLDVKCYDCKSGEYLGMINVRAGYDDFHKDCMRDRDEARSRCSGAYGVPTDDVGMSWKYRLGLGEWKNWTPRNGCPAAKP